MGLLSEDDLDYYLSQLGAYFAIMLRDNPDDTYKELYSHYDAVREHIQTLEKTNGWISVRDKMPGNNKDILIYGEWTGQSGAKYREIYLSEMDDFIHQGYTPIAWMPIPEPPKEG